MNIKAAYYAFSRMLLPTITVIGLILLSTLSIDTTFGFLMQKTWVSGLLRVALLAVELVWFYYLYQNKTEELATEQAIKEGIDAEFTKPNSGRLDYLVSHVLLRNSSSNYDSDSDTVAYKKVADKLFLVKLLK